MLGCLLDTNHIDAIFLKKISVMGKINSLPVDTQLRVCAITLGEIEAGHRMTQTTNQRRRDDFTTFVNEKFLPNALPISHSTRLSYAEIISRIWNRHPPANPKSKTEAHLLQLGVDVNDVWTVSVAWEHGLIFVTQDKMKCIKEAVPEVQTECWL